MNSSKLSSFIRRYLHGKSLRDRRPLVRYSVLPLSFPNQPQLQSLLTSLQKNKYLPLSAAVWGRSVLQLHKGKLACVGFAGLYGMSYWEAIRYLRKDENHRRALDVLFFGKESAELPQID